MVVLVPLLKNPFCYNVPRAVHLYIYVLKNIIANTCGTVGFVRKPVYFIYVYKKLNIRINEP